MPAAKRIGIAASAVSDGTTRNPPKVPRTELIDREILSIAIPSLAALSIEPLLSLLDTAFIGHISPHATAGVAVASTCLSLATNIFYPLTISITPLLTRALHAKSSDGNGKATNEKASRCIAAALQVSFVLGLLSSIFLMLTSHHLVAGFKVSSLASQGARDYIKFRLPALPFVLATFVITGAQRAYKDVTSALKAAFIANILNTVLDIILIFGFNLGAKGAAIATSISQIFTAVFLFKKLVRKTDLQTEHLRQPPSYTTVTQLISDTALLTIRTVSLLITFSLATRVAAARGVFALAAHEICQQIWLLLTTLQTSFTTAAQALTSNYVHTNPHETRRLTNRILLHAATFGMLISIPLLFASPLTRLFTNSSEVRSLAVRCVRIAMVCVPLNGVVFAMDGVLSALRDYKFLAGGIAVACSVACMALVGVWSGGIGVGGVWMGVNLLMVARAIVLGWRYLGSGGPMPHAGSRSAATEYDGFR